MTELIDLLDKNDKLSGLLFEKFLNPNILIEEHKILPDFAVEYDELFFEKFKDRIEWNMFCANMPLDNKIIWKFKDFITNGDFGTNNCKGSFSSNTKIKWTLDFIDHNYEMIDWNYLTLNPSVPWDKELYEKYQDKIFIIGHLNNGLIGNKGIFWKEDLISATVDPCDTANKKKWYLEELTRISNIEWNLNLICKYYGLLNLQNIFHNRTLSINFDDLIIFKEQLKEKGIFTRIAMYYKLQWNFDYIKLFENFIDFEEFSKATNILWTEEIFNFYIKRWNFNNLSSNSTFCWTDKLYNQHKDKWNQKSLSNIYTFPWTDHLIEKNIDNLDLNNIVSRSSCFLSGKLINKFKDIINWNGHFRSLSNHRYIYEASAISRNRNIQIDIKTLKLKANEWKSGDKINAVGEGSSEAPGEWYYYSMNKYLTDQHLIKFADKMSWDVLSKREDIDWSIEHLSKFSEYWKWEDILTNKIVLQNIILPNMNAIKLYFQLFKYNKHWGNFINKGGWKYLKR